MNINSLSWIAFVSMAFSAEGLDFPAAVKIISGEPFFINTTVGVWTFTLGSDFLFCELCIYQGGGLFNCDLVNPTGEQVLRSIDLLINLARVYVKK